MRVCVSDYKTHLPIWEENGGVSYSPNVAYLACWGGWAGGGGGGAGSGAESQEAEAGSLAESRRWQEWGDATVPGLGGRGVPAVRSKGGRSGVPAVAYYSAREEGTGGACTLGEESLGRRPYVPPSRDWCVPH